MENEEINAPEEEIPEPPREKVEPIAPEPVGLDLETVYDLPVKVSAVLGRAHIQIGQFLKLSRGSVIALDRCVGDPIDIYVNDRLVARGEIVVVDQALGISMTEIIAARAGA
ncbi:MAG: flagellar motor switch protein FliN [Holosporales bacterium]|jgi:flagellar motor switch protein FliN/FliY|nr:flagellar motor switch protein FliN [Holosporales bacterium]